MCSGYLQVTPVAPSTPLAVDSAPPPALAPVDPRTVAKETVEACIATRLRQLNRVVTNHYDQALQDLGMTSNQASMLAVIAVLGEPTPSELEPILMMDASTISRNVKLLIQNKWVALIPGQDRRSHHLVVSPTGIELMAKAYPRWKKAQRWAEETLGQDGVRFVKRATKKVNPAVP